MVASVMWYCSYPFSIIHSFCPSLCETMSKGQGSSPAAGRQTAHADRSWHANELGHFRVLLLIYLLHIAKHPGSLSPSLPLALTDSVPLGFFLTLSQQTPLRHKPQRHFFRMKKLTILFSPPDKVHQTLEDVNYLWQFILNTYNAKL